MTVQEIQEIGFEKAVFGGYDMKSVDAFLEKVAEEFAAMQKENETIKAKMKVLVEKIEEYRNVEEGMRKTLATAQSIAQETINKAKNESEEMLKTAQTQTEQKIDTCKERLAEEEKKLAAAQDNTAQFVQRMILIYDKQADALKELVKKEKIKLDAPANKPDKATASQTQKITKENKMSETSRLKENIDFGELKFGTDYDSTNQE